MVGAHGAASARSSLHGPVVYGRQFCIGLHRYFQSRLSKEKTYFEAWHNSGEGSPLNMHPGRAFNNSKNPRRKSSGY